MENGFEYETQIRDGISGPAGKESSALEQLALAAIKSAGALEELAKKNSEAGESARKHKGMLSEFAHDFRGSLVPEIAAGELLADGIKEAVSGMVELTIEGARFALEMREFKEDAILAYSVVYGTAEEGEKAFEEIDKLGRNVHMPVEKAHDLAQQLMTQGLENMAEVQSAIQAVSDLERTGNERGAAKFQAIIERSLATGTFAPKGKMLAGTGVQMTALLNELAANLHQPVSQIQAELKAGKIGAEQGIVALENVFAKSKVHEIASKNFNLTDITTDLKNNIKGLFQDVDTEPLMHALFNMSWAFGQASKEGGGLKGVVTDTFNWIIREVSPVIDAITELALRFEIGMLKARLASKPLTDEMAKLGVHVDVLESLGSAAEALGYGLTRAAIAAAWLYTHMARGAGFLVDEFKKVGSEIGNMFGEGVADGIAGKKGQVDASARDLMNAGVEAAKKTADIHSPSGVTYDMGVDLTKGLTLALDDGHPDVARAMGDWANAGAMAPVANDNGASRHVTVEAGAVEVHITVPQPGATADEIREITESAVEDAVEKLVMEMGG